MKPFLFVAALALVAAACGTEEPPSNDGGVGECDAGEGLLYPMEEGAWWRYSVEDTQSGDPECPDKLVSIGAPDHPLHRPDVWAYPALSEQPGKHAIRWQEITENGSVLRHVDEWFDDDDSRLKIIYYCPYKTRVDDGAHACPGATWTEQWRELQVNIDDPAAGEDCADFQVDPATCDHDDALLHAGCSIEASPNDGHTHKQKSWQVVSIDESITVVPVGTFSTLHVHSNDLDDGETDRWWARGVGKIVERGAESQEELVSYCLPTNGCDAGPPEDLDAGCGD